jgi:hypothetical protein
MGKYQVQMYGSEAPHTEFMTKIGETFAGLEKATALSQLQYTTLSIGQGSAEGIIGAKRQSAGTLERTAGYYENLANDRSKSNLLTPLERDRYATTASNLKAQAVQQKYEATQQLAGYKVATAGVGVARAEAGIGVAQVYGDPTKLAEAIQAEFPKLKEELNALNKQMKTASTFDLPVLQSAYASLGAKYKSIQIEAIQAHYGGLENVESIKQSGYQATTQFAILTKGTGVDSFKEGMQSAASFKRVMDDATKAMSELKAAGITENSDKYQEQLTRYNTAKVSEASLYRSQVDYTPSPEQQTRLNIDTGQFTRMGYGFAQQGSYQDVVQSLMSDYKNQLKDARAQYTRVLAKTPDGEKASVTAEFSGIEQNLLNEIAQAGYQSDMMFGRNLPTMLMGDSSFSARTMPSRAQQAMALESQRPSAAARTSGFFSSSSGDMAMISDSSYLATGKNAATAQPGNWSLEMIAALTKSLGEAFKSALSGTVIKLDTNFGMARGSVTSNSNQWMGSNSPIPGVPTSK